MLTMTEAVAASRNLQEKMVNSYMLHLMLGHANEAYTQATTSQAKIWDMVAIKDIPPGKS